MICSRDWQEFLDKMERIAIALETLATAEVKEGPTDDELKALTDDANKHASALTGALNPK